MDAYLTVGSFIRLCLIVAGLVNVWTLWRAKRVRHGVWTPKMRDIWTSHFLFVDAIVAGNVELFFRHVQPTYAVVLLFMALGLSIKATSEDGPYTQELGQ